MALCLHNTSVTHSASNRHLTHNEVNYSKYKNTTEHIWMATQSDNAERDTHNDHLTKTHEETRYSKPKQLNIIRISTVLYKPTATELRIY
jgi:hypothetical protein